MGQDADGLPAQTYPFGIFGSTVIASLNPEGNLIHDIGYGTVLILLYLPGTIIGGYLMDRIGRKQTMALGFLLWSIMGFIIGGALNQIVAIFPLFVVLYAIFNALGELGPGVSRQIFCDAPFSLLSCFEMPSRVKT